MSRNARPVQVSVLGDDGLAVAGGRDVVFDVLFDDTRVWGFTPEGDLDDEGRVRVAWPKVLRPLLDGVARVTVRQHHTGEVVADEEVAFGSGQGRVRVVDKAGRPVAVTKYGRLNHAFDTVDAATKAGYLDQVEEVLAVLRDECGLPAFVSWGTLLGAVRSGELIGHDVDADLAYYSEHEHPVDVVRESFAVERALRARGWRVRRENGGFLALFLPQADGTTRNMDVFTCWRTEGWLYLVHDVRARLPRSAVLPLSTVVLEGRRLPAPADPEALLAASYGPGWRVPDPSFTFTGDAARHRRMMGWLGGLRRRRDQWNSLYAASRPDTEHSPFAGWVAARDASGRDLVDLGSGRGADALWFARQGRTVRGVDFVHSAVVRATGTAETEGLPATFEDLNLVDLRAPLALGADLARRDPATLFSRQLLCELDDTTRAGLGRTVSMALRRGGDLFLEVHTTRTQLGKGVSCRGISEDALAAFVEDLGGTVEEQVVVRDPGLPPLARLHARWPAPQGAGEPQR
ncbi:Thiopurine S-methyltransferase (TPMT) [Nocardioides scoriae]|uniref:Thiopurine S-methyltransferase (TPMT) n=1 Tax=Nocardioides scoriae TaxID=642780 RepID=A0A1H1QYI0_9ACTN|nr:class I SAM-dependent methyltransferase [Nocardioides scoriae]SDS28446.1 Thiopurine S-methyltransferase (TPMT) [Nocardioides scoriae]